MPCAYYFGIIPVKSLESIIHPPYSSTRAIGNAPLQCLVGKHRKEGIGGGSLRVIGLLEMIFSEGRYECVYVAVRIEVGGCYPTV